MRNPLKRITVAFVLIALIPVGFIIHELSSLNKNEQVVRQIYENQLDAILYSVNQYSDDIISSWANRVINGIAEDSVTDTATPAFLSALSQLNTVRYVYLTDLKNNSRIFGLQGNKSPDSIRLAMDNIVSGNRQRINKLITYQRAGFRKMDAIDTLRTDDSVPVFFVLDEGTGKYVLGAMILDLPQLINNVLGPKMQSVSQQKFIITAFKTGIETPVYSTASFGAEAGESYSQQINAPFNDEWQKREFWLVPGYYLGISLKEATIDGLVKDRIATSLTILVLLILILTAGIVFLYRNIRHEISLSQAKSEFVSNVSHEIRTPLSLISMYAETLEMNRIPEDRKKEYYRVIAKETGRLSLIVNRILNFSRIEANKKNYDIRPLQLNTLCSEIIESYSLHLKDSGFTYEYNPGNNVQKVYGDREAISEAIINLLDNAIKYSRDKKHISMKTGISGTFAYVEVKDEGIGIAKNYQREIFEQFYRAPTGDVHTTKGSGLGLTLVKRIMDAHQGKVKVESAPDKGSTFSLHFPIKRESHES